MTHVLAVRMDNDGDVLLAGPAIRALEAGADRVTLLCGPRGRQAAALLPGVDEVVCWRAPWIDPEPEPVDRADVEALIARIAALRADRAIVFGSFHQSPLPTALVLRLAGVPWIGATSIDYPGSLLDLRHRIDGPLEGTPDDVHEVERSLDLVRAAGFELPAGDDGGLRVLRDPIATPAAVADVVVHPGASVPARAWAPERNAELVDALVASGRTVAVTGGAGERELTGFVAGPPRPEVTDLGGATDLAGLAEVLAAARVVVVGNTGPAHLAAAVGTPVVSLFAPTVPAVRWRPWHVVHDLLYVDVPCAGCRAHVCPVPGHPCLGGVEVEDVLAAVERLAPVERGGDIVATAGRARRAEARA
jgi:ADP-heptose:LPS heptosyltransferase